MPDALSRVPLENEEDRFEEEEELDVERRLLVVKAAGVEWEGEPLKQSGRYLTLEMFLTTLACPPETSEAVRRWVKRRSANFFMHEAQLWRRSSPIPLMVVTVVGGSGEDPE
ncbi:hypothetical protein PSTG_19737, partial [Puccinia striiformis f. sp. tritici PST-78]